MESPNQVVNPGHTPEAVALNDGPAPENSGGQKDTTLTDMLRFSSLTAKERWSV